MRTPNFWYGKSVGAKFSAALLAPIAALYGAGIRFRPNSRNPFQPHAHVVCVGNLTLGGTGKTPIAIALANVFLAQGAKVAFLSRGYKGRLAGPVGVDLAEHSAADVGDEPLLLAQTAPTIVSRDRRAGAVMADALGANIVILDDGHQNFSLRKNLSLVVVDAEAGFGNGYLFPAGPLREPIREGLERADAAIIVGEGDNPISGFTGPILRARLVPTGRNDIAGKRLVAFAGIGRPEKFFTTLREMGGQICAFRCFADHHPYSGNQIRKLRADAERLNAHLVTTQKDFVRIADHQRGGILSLPVRAAFEDERALSDVLQKASGKAVWATA